MGRQCCRSKPNFALQEAIKLLTLVKFEQLIKAWFELAISTPINVVTGLDKALQRVGNQCAVSAPAKSVLNSMAHSYAAACSGHVTWLNWSKGGATEPPENMESVPFHADSYFCCTAAADLMVSS